MPATIIKMTSTQATLCKSAMAGENASCLLDILTDQILLSDQLSPEEMKGAGKVIKFLRDLHDGEDHFIKPEKSL